MASVVVIGPDGKRYQFPDGTTKETAIAYFKKKGVGGRTFAPAKPPSEALLQQRRAISAAELEANKPESTISTRTREAAIGVLEPLTAESLYGTAKTVGSALYHAAARPADPKTLAELRDLVSGVVKSTGVPIQNFYEGWKTGDYDRAAYGAGGMLSQTAPAEAAAVETLRGAIRVGPEVAKATPGFFKEKLRSISQGVFGANEYKTTEPLVREYSETLTKAQQAQVDADAAVAKKNLEAEQAATAKTAENKAKTATEIEARRRATGIGSRVQGVERSLEEGSAQLGERVKDLDSKLRTEGNEKYEAVRQAVKDDPGVPLSELAQAARFAESNILKGSAENIKQFRELARKAPEESGVQTSLGFLVPGDPLYDMLSAQGAIDTGGNLPFDQLQGYSSEIGTKLAKGGLPGDIYQALKYLKEKIDVGKATIADRNGAGATLRNADSFWANYMDLFYDSDSAVTKVRESVGTLDPQYYADAFTKGKAGDVAISKLKQMRSRHAADASGVADLARNLRSASGELATTKVPTLTDVKPPKTVVAKQVPREVVEQPSAPTAGDIVEAKKGKLRQKAQTLQELHWRDPLIAGGALAWAVSDPLKAIETVAVGIIAPKVVGRVLDIESVRNWIVKPMAGDVEAAMRLPEPARTTLVSSLQQIINQERAAGRSLIISPQVQRLINQAGNVGAIGVRNRREAMERLGRPLP